MYARKKPTRPAIAILTDFGNTDHFVGVMKGVLAQIAPGVPLIDITHAVPPGDIRRGAVSLWQAAPYFPAGTIFLCVVDPGVGTPRHPIILETSQSAFVGPDNGLFTFVAAPIDRAWRLENPAYALPAPSNTFHGRDRFAPAAAHAANGVPGQKFGKPLGDPVRLPAPHLELAPGSHLHGEILHADQFGNLLTSLGQFQRKGQTLHLKPWLGQCAPAQFVARTIRIQPPHGASLPLARTFAEIPLGQCAGIIGSSGLLEIVANGQSAKELLGLDTGRVTLLCEE